MKYRCLIPFLFIIFFSCKKQKPELEENKIPESIPGNGVFILNEGNFMHGNASLSLYDEDKNEIFADVFTPANGFGPGDVLQSACFYNNQVLLVMNNSNKIIAVNKETFVQERVYQGFNSPRYLLVYQNNAFITELYSDKIYVLNLTSGNIEKEIKLSGWTEELILVNNEIWVSNKETEYVYVIQPQNAVVIDSVHVAYGSNSLVKDKNNRIWVLASGSSTYNKQGALASIDPVNRNVIYKHDFQVNESPFKLRIDEAGNKLYFIHQDIIEFDISTQTMQKRIEAGARNFYGLAINPYTRNMYISDAIDYNQKGTIYLYDINGNEKTNFKAGIIPGEFLFFKKG